MISVQNRAPLLEQAGRARGGGGGGGGRSGGGGRALREQGRLRVAHPAGGESGQPAGVRRPAADLVPGHLLRRG